MDTRKKVLLDEMSLQQLEVSLSGICCPAGQRTANRDASTSNEPYPPALFEWARTKSPDPRCMRADSSARQNDSPMLVNVQNCPVGGCETEEKLAYAFP